MSSPKNKSFKNALNKTKKYINVQTKQYTI